MSDTENPILSGWDGDGISERLRYQTYFRDQLELDHLLLTPDLIFAAPDPENICLCCHPGYRSDFFDDV